MKKLWVLFAIIAGLSGCGAPKKMAFQDDGETVVGKQNPVFLMTANFSNVYKPSSQPELRAVHLEKLGDVKRAERFFSFPVDEKAKAKAGDSSTGGYYLIRFELEPGKYVISSLSSTAVRIYSTGIFVAPLHSELEAKGPGVFYLGHVNATVRERKEGEFRAGSITPLLDQALVGASDGTFDVEITDKWAVDEAAFRSRFPSLKGVTICRIPDDYISKNRYPLFMARAVMRGLIESLQSLPEGSPC